MDLEIQKIVLHEVEDNIRDKFLDYQEALHAGLDRDEVLRSRDHRKKISNVEPAKNQFQLRYFAFADNQIVGTGYAGFRVMEEDTNSDSLWMYIAIIPEYRTRGIATKLLQPLLEFAEEHNRPKIETGFVPTDVPEAEKWIKRLGFKDGFSERVSRLYRDKINWDYINKKEKELSDKYSEYEFIRYDRKTFYTNILEDDEFAEKMADFYTEADNLLPRENAEWNDVIVTKEDMRVSAEHSLKHGDLGDSINYYCFHNDRVVAMSGTYFANDPPVRDVGTGLTAVRKDYQRQGLATYLKILITKYYDSNHDEFEYIQTENAGSNEGMLYINKKLGYEYQWNWNLYQGQLEDVRNNLKE